MAIRCDNCGRGGHHIKVSIETIGAFDNYVPLCGVGTLEIDLCHECKDILDSILYESANKLRDGKGLEKSSYPSIFIKK